MMNAIRLGLLTLFACYTIHDAAAAGRLDLVRGGQPVATIVVPTNARKWENTAAQWLREYVQKISGAELTIVTEDKSPKGSLISVGHTKLAAKAGIDDRNLKGDGCKLIVKGDVLYLLGRESPKELKSQPITGPKGTCRAVLTFLEDHCGVRWFLPTPEGELIPTTKNISVPRDLSKTFVPAFANVEGRFTYTPGHLAVGGDTPASIINNYRQGVLAAVGGHTYYDMVPAALFKDHPEYFALIDGERTAAGPSAGNHLCTSNPHVKKLMIDWVRARFDEGYEWVAVAQEDGFRRCECEECEKLDNYRYEDSGMDWNEFMYGKLRETPAERLFLLHKAVIDEVAKSHPDKKVVLMCYGPTAWPSKKIDYFGDNVILQLMNVEPQFIDAWKGKAPAKICYICLYDVVGPMGLDVHYTPREIAEKVRYLIKNNFLGLNQFAETGWGFQGPIFYTFGKLLGDPTQDHQSLVEEYCRGVYGNAAAPMLQFFNDLYARHEKVLPLPVEDYSGRLNMMPPEIDTAELYVREYPPAFLEHLESLLQKAEREADTERARGWVRLTRDHFDFTKLLTYMVLAHRTYQANASKQNWQELKSRVEVFDAYRMKVLSYPKEYTDRWFPAYSPFCNFLTADTQHELKVYHTPWEKRKADVLARGVKGMAIGYGGSRGYSFIKEPLTLDFSKTP